MILKKPPIALDPWTHVFCHNFFVAWSDQFEKRCAMKKGPERVFSGDFLGDEILPSYVVILA